MNKTWQDRVKSAMLARGVTRQQLMDRVHVTKGTMSNWFSGGHQPSLEQLREIAEMVGLSLADILSEDDALARNAQELRLLRSLRDLPADQQERATELIASLLQTLAKPPAAE